MPNNVPRITAGYTCVAIVEVDENYAFGSKGS